MSGGKLTNAGRYVTLTALTAVLAVVGYAGYVLYPRFDLPADAGAALLFLAAAAGVASFFSPCSFPLLVSVLGRAVTGEPAGTRRLRRSVAFAAALSLGAVVFLLLVGALVGLIGTSLFAGVTFTSTAGRALRIAVGGALILLGLIQTGRLDVSLRWFQPALHGLLGRQAWLRRRYPPAGYTLFGFVYLLAGFG